MTHILTLIANPQKEKLSPSLVADVQRRIGAAEAVWLAEGEACDLALEIGHSQFLYAEVQEILEGKPVDWALLPVAGRKKKLLVSDMDSTIIEQECIDELAKELGVGEEVAAITERAMKGELDFVAALTHRVSLLKGLPEATLEKVFREKITLMPGARTLVRTMCAQGAYTLLVSGGFTFFTGRVRAAAGFDEDQANVLEIEDGKLTGKVVPPILEKNAKRDALVAKAQQLKLHLSETMAIGDGANDVPMIQEAGLGVAYHGKEIVRQAADVSINHCDLTALLYVQGYRREEWVTGNW